MKILVPTDFSPQAEAAADLAVEIARRTKGEVIFHHAFSTIIDWAAVTVEEENRYPEVRESINKARQRLKAMESRYSGVVINT